VSYKFKGYKGSIKCCKCDATSENGMALMWFLSEDGEKAMRYTACPKHAQEIADAVNMILPEDLKDVPVIYESTWHLLCKDWSLLPEGGQVTTKEQWGAYMDMLIEENFRS